MLDKQTVKMLRSFIKVCKTHNVMIQPTIGYLELGDTKVMKITPECACVLGKKDYRTVTHTVTLRKVTNELQ